MAKLIDLTGQKFGKLTVVERAENTKDKKVQWKCICDCGSEIIVIGTTLRKNSELLSCKSCRYKAYSEKYTKPMISKRFGRLVVLERIEEKQGKTWKYLCKCDCGNEIIVLGDSLRSGGTKSCGCYHNELLAKRSTTHGDSKTRLYRIWRAIKKRCYSENYAQYNDYGGRGISMCESWKDSFESFKEWSLENGYSDDLSIDRVDVNRNYEPLNCRWLTIKEQQNNKRNNHLLTYNGKTQTMRQWADELGLGYFTLAARLNRYGWTVEEALSTPAGQPRNNP